MLKSALITRNIFVAIIFSIILISTVEAESKKDARYKAVMSLQPVGFWHADDGSGDVLYDCSGNENHGKLHHLSWAEDLLDFTGAYQWVEIPYHKAYNTRDFSLGGWIFTRSEVIGGKWPGKAGMTFIGNGYHQSGYTLETLYDENVLFQKSDWGVLGGSKEGVSLCVRKGEKVDIISGGNEGVLPEAEQASIARGKWQHIIYTFEAGAAFEGGSRFKNMLDKDKCYQRGVGKLYVNGELVSKKSAVRFKPSKENFLVGSDAVWWLQANVSGSLDGSVRDIVIFDKVLRHSDVKDIYINTKPEAIPDISKNSGKEHKPLLADKSDSQLLDIALNENSDIQSRAQAVFALNEREAVSTEVAKSLAGILEKIYTSEGGHLPRVEDHFRNAIIVALLENGSDLSEAEEVLGMVYAKPILDSLDLSAEYLDEVKKAYTKKAYMDALDKFRHLTLDDHDEFFFSQGDINRDQRGWQPNTRAYTAADNFNGHTYICGEGAAWKGVEKVPFDEYKELMVDISKQYPEVLNWRGVSYEHLYRVPITKTYPDGREKTVYLEGEKFILDGIDMKLRGWSIAVDNDGYIHITGGMHNAPVEDNFIPGSWEKMGISREYTDDEHPSIMYWVSTEPESIDSFEFMGQRSNRRNVPVPFGLNYMNFIQDRNGELYLYGRIHVQGIQSFGLYKYNTDSRRWKPVGGFAPDVKKQYPHWSDYHIRMATDWLALPTMRWRNDIPCNKTLVWARQPHFYNYMRGWGVRFDKSSRMHVLMPIFGLNEENKNVLTKVYAYSDDDGETFFRADGSEVKPPLTNNPSAAHNAQIEANLSEKWFSLWESLITYAGYRHIR